MTPHLLRTPAAIIATCMLGYGILASASAQAAVPPTFAAPSSASLATGKPRFTWSPGPAGEIVHAITISRRSDLSSLLGGGQYLYHLDTVGSATAMRELAWGRWYWGARWHTPPEVPTYVEGDTTPRAMFIPGYLRQLRSSYTQYASTEGFSTSGTFFTNATQASVTCQILQGRRTVSREVDVHDHVGVGLRMGFACRNLEVPERLDGRRLTLRITARGAGKAATITTSFTAR